MEPLICWGSSLASILILHLVSKVTNGSSNNPMEAADIGRIGLRGRERELLGDDHLEMWVILTKLGDEALGRIAFTVIFLRAILLDNRLGHPWNHF